MKLLRSVLHWILMFSPFFFAPAMSQADHAVISFGPSLNGATNPKFAAIGYEKVFSPGSALFECGAMFESPINGTCALLLNARLQTPGGMFVRMGAGPGVITHTDDRLSSNFEFNLQSALGFSQDGWDVGLAYKHWSNAGIWPPNFGRDFWGGLIEIGL